GRSPTGSVHAVRGHVEVPRPTSLVEALQVLPARDRAVVVSRYYLGLSPDEIAEMVGVDAEEVDSIAVGVLAALRHATAGVGGSG
ncbi:MAG TPA: sigma-70 family RNA polymerase sigma factor, partial [Mycobacteriales bacterium]|nr:sigma-70 family RNA polymerase sigma factor [Mycobacteriales bacterium]